MCDCVKTKKKLRDLRTNSLTSLNREHHRNFSIIITKLCVADLLAGEWDLCYTHKIYQQNPGGIRVAAVTIARQLEAQKTE